MTKSVAASAGSSSWAVRLSHWHRRSAFAAAPIRAALTEVWPTTAIAVAITSSASIYDFWDGCRNNIRATAFAATPLVISTKPAIPAFAPIVVTITDPAAIALRPAYRVHLASAVSIAAAFAPRTAIMPTAVFAVPAVAAFAPVTTVAVAHIVALTIIVEQEEAVTRIPQIVIPAAAITNVGIAVAIVAVVITIERAVRIAVIIAAAPSISIAVAGITKPHVISAARNRDSSCRQRRDPQY